MTFKKYTKFTSKDFIRVREICVSLSTVAYRKLKSDKIDFSFDKESKQIKIIENGDRRIVNKTTSNPFVSAAISRYMPMGRYFLTKEGNYQWEENL